jgi:hypothetical protein
MLTFEFEMTPDRVYLKVSISLGILTLLASLWQTFG